MVGGWGGVGGGGGFLVIIVSHQLFVVLGLGCGWAVTIFYACIYISTIDRSAQTKY